MIVMRKTYFVAIILVVAGIIFTWACGKKYSSSRHGENKSHYQGGRCVTCHTPGSNAKNLITVGGTVYDEVRAQPQKKALVKLYTEPKAQGKLIATLQTDEQGNFYSTQRIDFSKGLFPTLLGTPGVKDDIKHMSRRVFTGDCNGCHGLFEESLGID